MSDDDFLARLERASRAEQEQREPLDRLAERLAQDLRFRAAIRGVLGRLLELAREAEPAILDALKAGGKDALAALVARGVSEAFDRAG